MEKPFLLVISVNGIRAVNLLQVVSLELEDKTLTMRMSNGREFNFSEKEEKLALLKTISDCATLPDGSPAGPQMQAVLEGISGEQSTHK
jgi:hypothetical protein